MAKTTKKTKVTKKVEKKIEAGGEYTLVLKFNDNVYEFQTDDIDNAIISVAPEFLKTKVIAFITKEGKTLERVIHLPQAKKLFWNRFTRESFIKNLIF